MTMNIMSGFRITGIYPVNRNAIILDFSFHEYIPLFSRGSRSRSMKGADDLLSINEELEEVDDSSFLEG